MEKLLWYPLYKHEMNLVLIDQDISISYIELRQKNSKLDITLHAKNSII